MFAVGLALLGPGTPAFAIEPSVAVGGTAGMDWLAGRPAGSPWVAVGLDLVDAPVALYFGVESQPTFFHALESDWFTAPLVMGTLAPMFGSGTTRVGPYATAGLFAGGGGLRAEILPWEAFHGGRVGVELRGGWLIRNTAQVGVAFLVHPRVGGKP